MNGRALAGAMAGPFAAWATLLAPPLVLASWIFGLAVWPALLIALVAAPPVFALVMSALRGPRARPRWLWMQAFGLGALLMPLVLAGGIARLLIPASAVGIGVLAAWVVLAIFANAGARQVHERHLRIDAPGLPGALRIVQLSDVHVGSRSGAFLHAVVARALALRPDLVVITGDLIDTSDRPEDALEALARLDVPCFMCIGNHERYTRLDESLAAIRATGVRVLRDEAVHHAGLWLIGIDDRDRPEALPDILDRTAGGDGFHVLLYHRPDGWGAARAAGIRLMLAGHTHGGQIWPFGLAVRRLYPEIVGRFDAPGSTLYVSPGTGTWGPVFRLGTRSEMTLVELLPT